MNPEQHARHWIECWNRRDLDGVLALFSDDVVFVSPRAAALTGNPHVHGKLALKAYWSSALERAPDLAFSLEETFHAPDADVLVIAYLSTRNGTTTRAIEVLHLGPEGKAIRGEAYFGAVA